MKAFVLDASALMTFFENRPGAGQVEALLTKGAESEPALLMSVVNWGEVVYSIWRARGEKTALAKSLEIAQLPIKLVEVNMELARLAASFKARYNLPYADCFGASLAEFRNATLVTSDKDFECVDSVLKILWL